ncbi:pyridoxamine 5'-phosphate oxidase family protein [Krasilnikoviella flava]|uniref:PPOX class probable F420-dependent enzyme n=1 Tax=Krasilnikoviella flava TaxID=526729 RepID=A0A1T5K6C5_9MICO|nr:pyridoxamine 5'-phosphate oxidase family protein [Krasilnikoviella flava]SKC59302.1 PPOX class probable F420-dependent enzyme [Krasilnikoviella flava]
MTPTGTLDSRFSEIAVPTPWEEVEAALSAATLYRLVTVRADGRPHVTPLVGLWTDDGFAFCTGPDEQKARNLAAGPQVAVTIGSPAWDDGLDVVVEGAAVRATGEPGLRRLADGFRAKYGDAWDFENDDESFDPHGQRALVYRVVADKVLAFAKSPHGQTTFRP